MRKHKILSVLLTLCLFMSALTPLASADILDYTSTPESTAKCVLLMDLDNGNELYAVNADQKAYPASTTKILTALLAVEAVERGDISLDDMVTAKPGFKEGITDDASNAGIKEGEVMSLRDLLYCAMLPSANEACNVIAMYVSDSIGSFVRLMNSRAAELGCTGSHFTNTNGMPDENHYTTARDLYLISAEAVKHETFTEICGTASYITAATNMNGQRELHNSNALINENSVYGKAYYYDDAYGVKTGRTDAAGLCLVAAAQRGGLNIMCVVLGADEDFENKVFDSFGDAVKLFDWAFGNFSYRCLLERDSAVGELPVVLGDGADSVALVADDDVIAFAPMGLTSEHIKLKTVLDYDSLEAPVKADTPVGKVEVYDEYGTLYGEAAVRTRDDVKLAVDEYLEDYAKSFIESNWIIIACALAFLVVLIFVIVVLRHKKRGKKASGKKSSSKKAPEKNPAPKKAEKKTKSKSEKKVNK
ncbi:MAG: D-alanyl-D-alanine carboxypeptidase family protein [Bacillota bacterium]|nr:D-alanyl-D-alanine carboxypeptidase family protein [Bacillota bacterium]